MLSHYSYASKLKMIIYPPRKKVGCLPQYSIFIEFEPIEENDGQNLIECTVLSLIQIPGKCMLFEFVQLVLYCLWNILELSTCPPLCPMFYVFLF